MLTIRSGGQTGVDRAAMDAAMAHGLPLTGWCPKGRVAEDGTIPARYPLLEAPSAEYEERTRRNVLDSDATLILTRGPLAGGTELTAQVAIAAGRPMHVVDLARPNDPRAVRAWLNPIQPNDLNVAGPRESEAPGIYTEARALLDQVLRLL